MYLTRYEQIFYEAETDKQSEESRKLPLSLRNAAGFETRPLGSNLESEHILGENDNTIVLKFQSAISWHTGNTVWTESKDALGNIDRVSMPEIYLMSTNTSVIRIPG